MLTPYVGLAHVLVPVPERGVTGDEYPLHVMHSGVGALETETSLSG